jgi:hypothetical protein
MSLVFRQAQDALPQARLLRTSFVAREVVGLLRGALRQRFYGFLTVPKLSSARRFHMRRFPLSAIGLMIVIVAGVVLSIEVAHSIQLKYDPSSRPVWGTMPGFFSLGFAIVLAVAAAIWGILYALHRSGMHRLSNVQTWTEQR